MASMGRTRTGELAMQSAGASVNWLTFSESSLGVFSSSKLFLLGLSGDMVLSQLIVCSFSEQMGNANLVIIEYYH
jgi:hypothetical protein